MNYVWCGVNFILSIAFAIWYMNNQSDTQKEKIPVEVWGINKGDKR